MKISNNRGIVLIVFLISWLSISCVNSSVACSSFVNTVTCVIESTNSSLVEETIASSLTIAVSILKLQIQGAGAGLALNISLPDNITELEIRNNVDTKMNIGAFTVNSGVESIKFRRNQIEIAQRNFFTFFPNLKHFLADALDSIYFPIFIQNKQLTSIGVYASFISEVSSRLIDHTLFVGLDKLKSLTWRRAGITGITPGSFKGLNKLTKLDLYSNMIQELKSCTFEGLENTNVIFISYNIVSSVHPNAFLGLTNLQTLDLNSNPSIPLAAITVLKNMEILNLKGVNPKNILSEIIQQLTNLTLINFNTNTFNCTCDTEWISKLSSFDVSISAAGSTCIGSSMNVDDPALYTNCEARSYQCFNKSIVCVGENWSRVDTVDGCECVYPEASYTVSEICNDINECENSTICQGNCTNTPGSYKCSCLEGFHNVNDTLCGDIDECIVGNGNCSHNCSNSLGSFECSCLTGYQKLGFFDCVDTNECLLSNGNCSHNCSNTVGSFECLCLTGYQKLGFFDCVDTNECLLSNGNCSHNCSNTVGSFECSCLTGYEKQGFSGCVDFNECLLSYGNCSHNCSNTVGSFECSCLTGYEKQGYFDCVDTNECLLSNGNCSHTCSNTVGSFECSCLTGYENQGFSGCVDTNECLLSNGNCSHNCSNTVGSFECSCLPGYVKHGSTECSLPNACSINNGGCLHNCTDTIDGYVCSCFEGFKVSPVNSSHCYKVLIPGTEQLNANSKETAFYVLLFLCFLFLATIVLLFVFLIFVFLYLRHQIQLLKPTPAPIVLSLAELDRKKQEESTVYGNPDTSQSVSVD